MINDGLNEFRGRRVLMLQGPVGPFFSRLSVDLDLAGAVVFKVDFNAGDWLFSQVGAYTKTFRFSGKLEEWPAYFEDLIKRLNIDTVLLFGDCRPIHTAVTPLIRLLNLHLGVFEEGYLRPDFITLERDGVNRYSTLPSDPGFYLGQPPRRVAVAEPLGSTYGFAARWGMMYFAAASLGKPWFWNYKHHRRLGFADAPYWLLSFWRRYLYAKREAATLPVLLGPFSKKFFLLSLQTQGDAQMSVHSRFDSVEEFVRTAVASFATYAPPETAIAIKHHPLDRGYSDYRSLIEELVQKHHLQGRCFYIHDQHLPTLLKHARGVVTVNSTVGLSAIGEGLPVKNCGEAVYDLQGLTYQDDLDTFWKDAAVFRPSDTLYRAFRNYLITHTQHQGSFYKKLPSVNYNSGIMWAEHGAHAPHHDQPVDSVPPVFEAISSYEVSVIGTSQQVARSSVSSKQKNS